MVEFDGYIDQHTNDSVQMLLHDPERVQAMTEHNYRLGCKHYSFEVLDRQLEAILSQAFGEETHLFWEQHLGQ